MTSSGNKTVWHFAALISRLLGTVLLVSVVMLPFRAKAQSASGNADTTNSPDSFSVTKYVVRGIVKDDNDAPVEGAALHIGREVAVTDSSGRFLARFSKHGAYPLSLGREELVRSGVYAVVSAPSEVNAESEGNAIDVQIVVRRIPPPQAKLYQQ